MDITHIYTANSRVIFPISIHYGFNLQKKIVFRVKARRPIYKILNCRERMVPDVRYNRADKLKFKACTMDGPRNFNSVIHFTCIPWIIRSEKDENMKYFTKRSLKFFPRYWLSMVTIPAGSTNTWSPLSFLEISSPTVILDRFQHAPESSLERRQNIHYLYKTT